MSNYSFPVYSVEDVNRSGKKMVAINKMLLENPLAPIEWGDSLDVIENWRAAHAYPAQNFFMTVKRHAAKIGQAGGVAQRIKRMPSILDKLCREDAMKLSQMQDIAGVRAVVRDLKQVDQLCESLRKANWSHAPLRPKDYIEEPKVSGYRGIHLKYKYSGAHRRRCRKLAAAVSDRTRGPVKVPTCGPRAASPQH